MTLIRIERQPGQLDMRASRIRRVKPTEDGEERRHQHQDEERHAEKDTFVREEVVFEAGEELEEHDEGHHIDVVHISFEARHKLSNVEGEAVSMANKVDVGDYGRELSESLRAQGRLRQARLEGAPGRVATLRRLLLGDGPL